MLGVLASHVARGRAVGFGVGSGVGSGVGFGVWLAVGLGVGLVLGSGLGCGRASQPPPVVQPRATPAEEHAQLLELRRELEATVLENYLQLGLGNMEAYADSIDTAETITLIGIGPDDVFFGDPGGACAAALASTAPDAAAQRRRACGRSADRLPFRSGEPCRADSDPAQPCLGVFSKTLGVRVSRDRTTAWVFDEISYRIPHRGRQAAMPLRYTAVYVRDVERWVMVMEHLSYPLPNELVRELAATGELAAPAPMKKHGVPSLWEIVHAHIALDAAARAQSPIVGPARPVSEQRVILLPDPRDELRGAEIFTAPNLADTFGPGTQVAAREMRVFFAPGARVAWLAGNLAMTTQVEGKPVTIGLRVTAVLEHDQNARWQVMQAHVSVPMRKDQLAARVLGTGLVPRPPAEPAAPAAPAAPTAGAPASR
jgi:ketosteroid isomerase-like protein